MKMKLLSGVAAAALIATGSIAYSQGRDVAPAGPHSTPAPQSAPASQQNAPAEKIAPAPSGTTGQPMDRGAPARSGADTMKTDEKAPKGAQAPGRDRSAAGMNEKPDGKARTTSDTQRDKSGASTTTTQSGPAANQTTGQGASGTRTNVNLNSEQTTKIKTVIKQQNVQPATNVNFNISIGTRVPRDRIVTYWKPLPATVVEVHPEWRGYYFILVDGQIVIIEPSTYEIVYVMAA